MATYPFRRPEGQSVQDALVVRDAELSTRLEAEILAGQSSRQREIARQIYERFLAGDEPDDVKDLIAQMCKTATENARHRGVTRRAGGPA